MLFTKPITLLTRPASWPLLAVVAATRVRRGLPVPAILAAVGFLVIIVLQVWSFTRNPISELVADLYIQNGSTRMWYGLNSGANKPLIEWNREPVVELSAWASDVRVNGSDPVLLWHHYIGAKTTDRSLYASYSLPDRYVLEQIVTLESANRVRVQFFVVPSEPLELVEFRLGHYRWEWDSTLASNQVFFAASGDVKTEILFGPNLTHIEANKTDRGVNFVDAYYAVKDVRSRTLLVDEMITFAPR